MCLCVSVCVCLCACPAFTAYISLSMDRILIKLGENVWTLVRLIVLKFHKNRFNVDVIPIFSVISKRSSSAQRETTLCKGKQLCCARLWQKRKRSSCSRELDLTTERNVQNKDRTFSTHFLKNVPPVFFPSRFDDSNGCNTCTEFYPTEGHFAKHGFLKKKERHMNDT